MFTYPTDQALDRFATDRKLPISDVVEHALRECIPKRYFEATPPAPDINRKTPS